MINASAGTYFGAHDGADPSAQFIHQDVTNNNGHLFVCSAGNAGDRFFHLRQDVDVGDTVFTLLKITQVLIMLHMDVFLTVMEIIVYILLDMEIHHKSLILKWQ